MKLDAQRRIHWTMVLGTPSSDRPHAAPLVSWVEGGQHATTRTIDASPGIRHYGEHDTAIRPFRVSIPESETVELRRRISATRWPSQELVKDRPQGVQLATLPELARYWSTEYDWRKGEARLKQRGRPRWPLRGVGRAHGRHVGTARRLQAAALICGLAIGAKRTRTRRPPSLPGDT
jgi:hypothetical protein